MARGISVKSKINSTFFLNGYRVTLLRYYILIRISTILRKSSRLANIAGSLIEYVIYYINKSKKKVSVLYALLILEINLYFNFSSENI